MRSEAMRASVEYKDNANGHVKGYWLKRVVKQLIVYKKVDTKEQHVIVKLLIKPGATCSMPSYSYNQKMRATCATVLSITSLDGKRSIKREAYSFANSNFKYYVGKVCKPQRKFSLEEHECGSGIHFFCTRQEAVEYTY